jgi:precorrin-3B synthase
MTVRGACPGLAAPMMTGDGLLLRSPPGWWTAATLAGIAEAAARFGNGVVEVTARGSLQLRGLSAATAAPCAVRLESLGLSDAPPVLEDPLADAPTRALAAAIRAAWPDGLAPKTSVVVDGGHALHLDAVATDLRLRRLAPGRWALALSGDRWISEHDDEAAAEVALSWLRRFGHRRARDVMAEAALPAPAERPACDALGQTAPGVLGLAAPFGAFAVAELLALAEAAPDAAFRPAPGRVLLAVAAPEALAATAEALGLITDPADPRRRVVACPGAPACASAAMPTRPLAARLAEARVAGLVHVSGCAKGCAHPAPARVTLVARAGGFDLVRSGGPRDAVGAILTEAQAFTEALS